MARFLHSDRLHFFMNVLLVLDLSILIISMQLELYYLDSKIESYETACDHHATDLEHYGTTSLHEAEEDLKWISIGILGIFIIENDSFAHLRQQWHHLSRTATCFCAL